MILVSQKAQHQGRVVWLRSPSPILKWDQCPWTWRPLAFTVTAAFTGTTTCWTIWRVRWGVWTPTVRFCSRSPPSRCSTCLPLPNTCRNMCPSPAALPACSQPWTTDVGRTGSRWEHAHTPAVLLPTEPHDATTGAIVQVFPGATVRKTFWTAGANPERILHDPDPGTILWPTTAEDRLDEMIIRRYLRVHGDRPMMRTADVEQVGEIILQITVNMSQERSRRSGRNASP